MREEIAPGKNNSCYSLLLIDFSKRLEHFPVKTRFCRLIDISFNFNWKEELGKAWVPYLLVFHLLDFKMNQYAFPLK